MPRQSDPRGVPGTAVYTRARLVTHSSECARLYGTNWKTKVVSGKIVKINTRTKQGKSIRYVEADWDLRGQLKCREIYVSGVTFSSEQHDDIELAAATTNADTPNSPPQSHNSPARDSTVTPVTHTRSLGSSIVVIGTTAGPAPVTESCEPSWISISATVPLNGPVPVKEWSVVGPLVEVLSPDGSPRDMRPLDCRANRLAGARERRDKGKINTHKKANFCRAGMFEVPLQGSRVAW